MANRTRGFGTLYDFPILSLSKVCQISENTAVRADVYRQRGRERGSKKFSGEGATAVHDRPDHSVVTKVLRAI